MKIVDIAEFYATKGGGVRTYVDQKIAAGRRLGHEIVVFAPGPEDGMETRDGGRIRWLRSPELPFDRRYYLFSRVRAIHRLIDEERPDVVEGSSPYMGGYIAARWRGPAAKTFVFHHDAVAVYPQTLWGDTFGYRTVDRLCGWYWAYLRWLDRRYDAVVVASQATADRLKSFGLHSPKVIPMGVEADLFTPQKRDLSVRRELLAACGEPETSSLLLCVGRLHLEKRLGFVIDAFAEARRHRRMGLVIIGDGPKADWVAQKAARVASVYCTGTIRDRSKLAACMASGDALVHGSPCETYGLVIAEALHSGLPVVAPERGGVVDLVTPECAETYVPGDVKSAANSIERLLSRDRQELEQACERAVENRIGTLDDHFANLFQFYGQLVEHHRLAAARSPEIPVMGQATTAYKRR